MALTEQQKQNIREYSQKTKNTGYISPAQVLEQRKNKNVMEERQGFFNRVKDSLMQRVENVTQTFKEQAKPASEGGITPLETGVRVVGQGVAFLGDIIGAAVEPAVKPVIEKIAETKTGAAAFQALNTGLENFEEWKKQSPTNDRIGKSIEGLVNISEIVPVGKGAKMTGKLAKTGIEVSEKVLSPVKKIIPEVKKVSTDVFKFGTGKLAGLADETVEQIMKNPEKITKSQLGGLSRMTLAHKVGDTLTKRLDDLSDLGTEYKTIKTTSKNIVKLPEGGYKNIIEDKFKLKIENGKIIRTTESVPMKQGDINALQEFYDLFGNKKEFNANEFLNARKQLDNIAKWEQGKTDASSLVSKELRKFHDKFGTQIKGLKELDKKYAPEIQELKQLKKEYFTKDGNLKDTALVQIANITGKGKDLKLKRLEKLVPGIEEDIKILKAIEDIEFGGNKVGTYSQAVLGGVGLATLNVPAIIGSILAQPKILLRLAMKYKQIIPGITDVINKIKKGLKLDKIDMDLIKNLLIKSSEGIGGAGTAGIIKEIQNQ